jgi:hypothetical protein
MPTGKETQLLDGRQALSIPSRSGVRLIFCCADKLIFGAFLPRASSRASFHHRRSLDRILHVKAGGPLADKLPAAWEHHIFAICRRRKSNGNPAGAPREFAGFFFVLSLGEILGGILTFLLVILIEERRELGLGIYSQAVRKNKSDAGS